jgi:GH25 family lysozyme M1 (1,4-beta-N-acetylmuramidase)
MKKVLSSVVLALALILPTSAFAMQAQTSSNLNGIDVSHWQGTVNWTLVKSSGISFTYVKAGGANSSGSYTDPMFAQYVAGAKAADLSVGAYWYALPQTGIDPTTDAYNQATYFANVMKQSMATYGDIMPVLDFETAGSLSSSDQITWISVFMDTVKHLTNRNVMLYSYEDFISSNNNWNYHFENAPLWIAHYTASNPSNPIPPNIAGWTSWTAWQYTETGSVPGVIGNVDKDFGPYSLSTMGGYVTAPTSTYVVKSGDYLARIAPQFGLTVSQLQALNNMGTSTNIYVGQTLKVAYTVQSGDSLSAIASRFGVSVSDLQTMNGIYSSMIFVGQILKI